MTIRKGSKAVVCLTSLFLLTLAVLPAKAFDTKKEVGDVVFTLRLPAGNSDKNDFDIIAVNRGKSEPTCVVTLTIKNSARNEVKAEYADDYPFKVKLQVSSVVQIIGSGLFDKKELPVTADFEPKCN
jgi:hypothetical protein